MSLKRNEPSRLSSSFLSVEKLSRSSKRFRPETSCQHVDKSNNEQCSADGFMECVHCEAICCLRHITEHQKELKSNRDQLVQEANDVFLTLNEMKVTDTRDQLQTDLNLWKQQMFKKIERTYGKLLDDIDKSFAIVNKDFETKKKSLANEFEENLSSKLENLAKKTDFYPHELDELKLSLEEMSRRIRETRQSIINIDYGRGMITSIVDDDQNENDRFDDQQDFQLPKILLQTKPDLQRIVNGSFLRQFQIEFPSNSDENSFLYETSEKHLIVYKSSNRTLELFDHEDRLGVGLWPEDSSAINSIKWSSYLKTFLILTSQSVHALNCSSEPFQISLVSQINSIDGIPMKSFSVDHHLMFIKHGNGSSIDCYSLKTMELIQRWSKKEFYPYDQMNIEIHRIEFYSNSSLAMNVEFDEENNVLDFFLLPNLQHLRRIENAFAIVYFPLNNYWLIKMKNEETNFALLDQHGQINRFEIVDETSINDFHFFGKDFFFVVREKNGSILFQLFHIDHL